MNLRPCFIQFATTLVLLLVPSSGPSAAKSEMPQSPAQDGTLKALAVIAVPEL
jgi:hypothetical protein